MAYEITGTLIEKSPVQQKSETFKTREFVIEKVDDIGGRSISNFIKFQTTQDRTGLIESYNPGDQIKVHFNIRGTKWNKDGKDIYFTNLDAWRIEQDRDVNTPATEAPPAFIPDKNPEEPIDDLPF